MSVREWGPLLVALGTVAAALLAALEFPRLALPIAAVGFFLLVPAAVALKFARRRDRGPDQSPETTARREATTDAAERLAGVRAAYERGDLSEAAFEERVRDVLDSDSGAQARAVIEEIRRGDVDVPDPEEGDDP
ncbi:MAG: hypothetical protein ABEJ30_03790 [Halorientalis sp.]